MIVRESEKEVLTVNNFEKLTKGPDALGAFLRTLLVLEGPWDAEFHARFCAGCAAENCDAYVGTMGAVRGRDNVHSETPDRHPHGR